MRILVVNDDGIQAPGLYALAEALKAIAVVTVVAPSREYSGTSGAITIRDILKQQEHYIDGRFFGYSFTGTPADCVKIALAHILIEKPDYVFSGINPGANLSANVHYSGTVAAASESWDMGIPSVAISQLVSNYEVTHDYSASQEIAVRWCELMERGLVPKQAFYNINLPNLPLLEMKGFAFSRLDPGGFSTCYEKRISPRGETYYWCAGVNIAGGASSDDSDSVLLDKGYVSVTPLARANRTDYTMFKELKTKGEPHL